MRNSPGKSHAAPGARWVAGAVALALVLIFATALTPQQLGAQDMGDAMDTGPAGPETNGTCALCHQGIEDMHPFSPVTCVQCHGGDASKPDKEKAHVKRSARIPGDERVLGRNFDLDYTQFRDPGNLRVAHLSCGPCHERAVYDTKHSLHATTTGHLGDGLYENGSVKKRHPPVAIFPTKDELPAHVDRPPTAVSTLKQIGSFRSGSDPKKVSTHFTDLPRKACMQCHLWSRGRAVRGRAGMDGDYRGEGCSACHVPYADDGLSLTRDRTVDKFEPGHPREHRMVRFPSTAECTRCHYGDASIGLSFRGLAQPVPGMPQTPDAPGLHKKRLNGMYYIDDKAATPADVHHQRGMHCADCHTRRDTMGDGFLYKRMEDAVETRCQNCHGTPDQYATGTTRRGYQLPHLVRKGSDFFLKSRVTGKLHRVKQARDVVRPGSKDYNERAANAMTEDHGRLECYSCHSGWNPNFFGFHFDRNEAFTQLDLLSGRRSEGRVTTQEKVFSTFKHYYLGWNSHGRIAPYMVGFSTMCTIHDDEGGLILDQALPETQLGLSGMTMIHHQTHTTTARARECVECHRSPATFGRGSVNFRLMRDFIFVGSRDGVRSFSLDRKTPGNTALLSSAPALDVRAIAISRNRNQGYGEYAFALTGRQELVVVDIRSPGFPKIVERVEELGPGAEGLTLVDDRLFVAQGSGGLRVFDVAAPSKPKQLAHLPDLPAYDVFADGHTLLVASGARGLTILDARDPAAPRTLVERVDLNGGDTATVTARRVEALFQYSRPNPEELEGKRSRPRTLVALACGRDGVFLVDATDPRAPVTLSRLPAMRTGNVNITDLALCTIYELGSEGGAIPTQERDYVFAVGALQGSNLLAMIDVTVPAEPKVKGTVSIAAGTRAVRPMRVYNPPFLQTFAVTAHAGGLQLLDVSRPTSPSVAATLNLAPGAFDVELEEFPLDRTVDSTGAPIMDVSHEGARWLDQSEFLRVMGVPVLPPPPETEDDGELPEGGR